MSTKYHASPVVAKKSVRPGESSEYVGTRNTTELLPAIFQTNVNRKFLDTTLEQLMSSGSLEAVNYYAGSKQKRKVTENYINDSRASDDFQFLPGSVVRDNNNNITQAMSYDDFLDVLKYNGVDVKNTNRIFNEPGYTLDLPINYDMFINYHHYFWLLDFMPVLEIQPTTADPITIEDIIDQPYYTTPTLLNGKTLEFQNGMRVKFAIGNVVDSLDYPSNDIFIVDGVGTGIKLTKQFENVGSVNYGKRVWFNDTIYGSQEPSQWNGDDNNFEYPTYDLSEYEVYGREYVVEQRHTRDQSAWSRRNLWLHEQTVIDICTFNGLDSTDYLLDKFRGIRPIIEFRANIEKFNFAIQSLGSVDYIFDNVDDPATEIIGSYNWNIASHTITTVWNDIGYDFGTNVKLVSNGVTSYWNCIKSHTTSKNPSFSENKIYWKRVQAKDLGDGDTVMFINSTNATYNNRIFTVVEASNQVTGLTELYGASSTALTVGDGINVRTGYNNVFGESYPNNIYSGSEWHWDGSSWKYSQQKSSRGDHILFQLYDADSVKLDDENTYPNNNFNGDFVFKYSTSENTQTDLALGIKPRYVDYGNEPGLSFDLGLGSQRYNYNNRNTTTDPENTNASVITEIPGYYYYKKLDNSQYYNGWVELRGGQPVKHYAQHIAKDSTTPIVINIENGNVLADNKFSLTKRSNKLEVYQGRYKHNTRVNGLNPALFVDTDVEYTFKTYFDSSDLEFVNADGSALTNVTRGSATNNVFTFTVAAAFDQKVIKYQLSSDNTVGGYIYVNSNSIADNFKLTKNGTEFTSYTLANGKITITSDFVKDDVIELVWHSDNVIIDSDGVDLVADTHVFNSQNDLLTSVSFGDILTHMKDQMSSIPGLSGSFYGVNNYRNLPEVHEFGGTIRQQPYSTELLAQSMLHNDTNIFNSLKHASNSYANFKSQFLQKCRQLHNTMDSTKHVYEVVDEALTNINVGKNFNDIFANSNMLKYKGYEQTSSHWTSSMTPVFDIPQTVNTYDDTKNHVQVFVRDADGNGDVRWRSLVKDVDYTITENKVTVTGSVTFDSDGQALINIRWYPLSSPSFVPPSAVKLGLLNAYVPSADSDNLYGHDGSIVERKGTELYNRNKSGFNIDDAVLWELETRIYNNLVSADVVDYRKIMPTANHDTVYDWDDLTLALRADFNKWVVKNNISSVHDSSEYDGSDPFTFNYSDVAPGIGGWRGIYTYYFNTDRPHTHPWEMFGYNTKPTWWDANYSWTDVAKRNNLIAALKQGHYNDPAQTPKFSIDYAYTAYDWDNDVLVTTAGVLNNPVIANVLIAPADPAKAFVFGDWGPVENRWRQSSEYKIALFTGLAKLRPLKITNDYFRSNTRTEYNFNTVQVAFSDTKMLGNNREVSLTNQEYGNNIIESVSVKTTGSGYSSAPDLSVYSNFGTGADLTAILNNGKVVAVSVKNPGKNYQTKPSIVPSSGTAAFDVVLASGAQRYIDGLSNAIVNFAQRNGTRVGVLNERFKNYSVNSMIKTGGFVNEAQSLILESSQDKGRVAIPEENVNTILYTSQPKEELFFGAVKVTKLAAGYRVSGYDQTESVFYYFKPRYGTDKVVVNVGNTQVSRYKLYEQEKTTLNYNSILYTKQDLYEFLLGYGEYLKSQGWTANWNNTAGNTILWSENADTNDVYYSIPSTKKIEIRETKPGYFSNIANKFDGEYNVVNKNGYQILDNKLSISRSVVDNEDGVTVVEAKSNAEIYGLRLYRVEIEHTFVVDNETDFDDMIYDPALGVRHTRVIWRGSRTKDWNGKLYAPGFIVNGNGVIPNFDTVAGEINKYYGPSNTLSNQQQVDAARFNIGYNKPSWNEVVGLDDDTLFNFIKGTRKYKGTKHALNAFMRNTALFGTLATAKVHEEWAVRTADYGDTRSRDTLEFAVNKELLKTNPQPVRFSATELNDVLSDITIDVDFNSNLLVNGTPGNNFTTRDPKTYNYTTISQEAVYANDLITAGLPLLTESDYRVLNREDFENFPAETKSDYSFEGEWKNIQHWDNKTAYKFKDKVIYQGRVWEMLDPDGTSGLTRPNDIITVTGTVSLPSIPSASPGETLIIDGTTVVLQRTTTSNTYGVIEKEGTNDLLTTNVVTDASTLILGTSSTDATTITFDTTVSSTVYNDVQIVGNVISPQIVGSATKELIIESTSVLFNQTESLSQNITAQTAFEQMFFDAFETAVNTPTIRSNLATQRVNRIEAFRVAYIAATSQATWDTFLTSYFGTSPVGLEIGVLLSLDAATPPSYQSELHDLISNDIDLINNSLGTSYNAANVIAGTETVTGANIASAQADLDDSTYPTDIKDWLVANSSTVFTTSVIVTTTSGTVFKTYNLSEIVQRINDANITNVTASDSNNRLVITKTTNTPSQEFTLTVSVATANSEVGFATSGPTIETSSGSVTTTSPNLTLAQVVDQINNANITGITALVGGTNNNLLKITSTNETLYIGNGTANSVIGLTVGATSAPTTTTTISTNVDLAGIIDLINGASVAGVTASNANNRLRLTSTNSTLVIGAGTANTTVGLTAQTLSATQSEVVNVFNAFVGSDGNQVFQEMENDPNVFSVWVADNKATTGTGSGYSVYQTMDFGMYITRACAGINDADDAQITIALANSNTQAHNLVEGDYVFITGSNSVPSIDGIHKVTKIESSNNLTFYVDEYIQEEGTVGNVYPLKNVRFSDYATLINNYNSQVNGVFTYNFAGLRQNNQQTPKLAFVDNDGTGAPAVYKYQGSFSNNTGHTGDGWTKLRTSKKQARNDLVESVKIYDANTRSLITQLEAYDPAKGIIPGFIDQEIDFVLSADLASYNYNTIDGFTENTRSWTSDKVGLRWWDINNAIYVDYEQDSVDYKQAYWGRLFDGASIDVYEWTRSTVLPEEWQTLVTQNGYVDGYPASGEPLSVVIDGETVYRWVEENYYNSKTKRTETSYYFWVKNKLHSSANKNYNTYQLARILENPTAFNISWFAAAGGQELLLGNVEQYVTNNSVVQINQRYDSDSLPMSEWTLLAEDDPVSVIPEYLHIKMRDSLVGYNRNTKVYSYTNWSNSVVYQPNVVVLHDSKYYISVASNTNVDPSTDTTMNSWERIYDYTLPAGTPESDISVLRPHALPDLNLHEYNRYGHLTRPRQSLVRNLPVARQNFVETANKLLAEINVVEEVRHWDTILDSSFTDGVVDYRITNYWNYIDYVRGDYDTSIPTKYTVSKKSDILGATTYVNGDTVRVTDVMHSDNINRPEIYSRIDDEWVLEWKEKGTIELSEELWNNEKFGLGFDLSGFDTDGFDNNIDEALSKIIDELRNTIFVGKHKVKYNQLWFKLLYQAVSDNTADDFAFKTTFVKLNVEHPLLTAREKYMGYNINVVEEFFNSIKPFHTKLHSVIDSNTHREAFETTVSEQSRKAVITMKYDRHCTGEGATWAGDTILEGGSFTADPANTDNITFTTADGDVEYIYNGNVFIQPVQEGWCEELYPVDTLENISIRVQTNPAGNTVDNTNTRTFQMNIFETYDIEESIAIVDAANTTLAQDISQTDTEITVADASGLALPSSREPGVIWIGSERIEYFAIDGNTLKYCDRGTYSTSAQAATTGTTVISTKYQVPTLEDFGHYGNNLRTAYNDSGVSLAANGTTPEHEFIRNAGFGTL